MKKTPIGMALAVIIGLASCAAPPSQKIAGTYSGTYTVGINITSGTLQVAANGDHGVDITFSPPSSTPITMTNVAITGSDDSYALTYTAIFDQVTGGFTGPNNITVTYTGFPANIIVFDGTK